MFVSIIFDSRRLRIPCYDFPSNCLNCCVYTCFEFAFCTILTMIDPKLRNVYYSFVPRVHIDRVEQPIGEFASVGHHNPGDHKTLIGVTERVIVTFDFRTNHLDCHIPLTHAHSSCIGAFFTRRSFRNPLGLDSNSRISKHSRR